jgi:hypothetical protein
MLTLMTKSLVYRLTLATIIAPLLFVPSELSWAQKNPAVGKPNLSGEWVLDQSKSSAEVVSNMTVLIIHNDPEIKMIRRAATNGAQRIDELIYYSDGRGEINSTGPNKDAGKTKTKWEGNKLVIKSAAGMVLSDGTRPGIDFSRTEKWQLKDDLLIWTTSFAVNGSADLRNTPGLSGPRRDDIKRVFRRSPP